MYNLVIYNISAFQSGATAYVKSYTLDMLQQYTSVDLVTETSVVVVDSLMDASYAGRAFVYNLLEGNAVLVNTLKSGTCGLPSNFNIVFSRSTVYNNMAAIWLLDGFGNGLGAVGISLLDFSCKKDAIVINLAEKLYSQRGFIPTYASYERFRII